MSRRYIIKITREKGPMSAKQLAAEIGINESSAHTVIRRARAHGTQYLRIAAWAGNVALYGPGPEPDTEDLTTVGRIMDYLQAERVGTNAQIAKYTGLSAEATYAATHRLHKQHRVYVDTWQRRIGKKGGRVAAVFAIGNRRDAEKPDFSRSQIEAEARQYLKRRIATALRTGKKLQGPSNRKERVVCSGVEK